MKKELIVYRQEYSIVCDNPKCDHKIPYNEELEQNSDLLINMPCPLCGENLLTLDDYLRHRKLMKIIKWVNKWFSWLTIFKNRKSDESNVIIDTHKKFTVKVENADDSKEDQS